MKEKIEYVTPAGSREKPVYSPKVLDDGSVELVETGKENIYDYIQSFRDTVDIHVILKKALAGDMSGLQRVQGFYDDATRFPSDRREMLQMVIDAQRKFDILPMEIKEQFDNDFNKFFVSIDSPEWNEKMKMAAKAAAVESEVKTVEQEQ